MPGEEDLQLWSHAIAAGIPNDLFWNLTQQEVGAVLKRRGEQERAKYLRAALISATIVNVNRKKGARLVEPGEFLRTTPREQDFMDVETATKSLDKWAASFSEGPSISEVETA